jgi:hypothetical protein
LSRRLKPATELQVLRVEQALRHLAAARELLKDAGADKAIAKTRLAIASAEGAQRHVRRRFAGSTPSQA